MTLMSSISKLTTSVDQLTGEANVTKAELDAQVAQADAEVVPAQAEQTATEAARDAAGTHATDAETHLATVKASVTYAGIDAILAAKAVTAADVFVYDTSQDSDGGAWRHRCQHTSWYNEPLNTTTRGGRREFPAVAVIVAEANKVTIYDGDDPALPMWMVFGPRTGDGFMAGSTLTGSADFSSYMHFFDGKMALSTSLGADIADFIADQLIRHPISGGVGGVENGISNRSATAAASGDVTALATPERVFGVGLVAARNAPICPKSKLPTPHIFAGGEVFTSIAPDGSKAEIGGGTGASGLCSFSKDFICLARDEDGNKLQVLGGNTVAVDAGGGNSNTAIYAFKPETNSFSVVASGSGKAGLPFSSLFAFNLLYIDPTKSQNTFTAGITSTYTTGWMPDDIKGAFLSDTDDTDLVGSENINFSSGFVLSDGGAEDWSYDGGADEWSIGSGSTGQDYVEFADVMETGKTYLVEFSWTGLSGGDVRVAWPSKTGFHIDGTNSISGVSGTQQIFITPSSGQTRIWFRTKTAGAAVTFTSLSVREADHDRSVNNKGLIVNGTVTRSPVATGADLLAYSGFSASNYLEQPYNPDLDFGTGDFCVMGWFVKGGANSRHLLHRRKADGTDNTGSILLLSGTDNTVFATAYDVSGSNVCAVTSVNAVDPSSWVHFAFLRAGAVGHLYLNGVLVGTDTSAGGDISSAAADATLRVGGRHDLANSWDGSMALLRIGATAPTPDQIAKIYEDERKLFQSGAKCTLYGASDAVTALAHDPKTNLLHVGTSAGRSTFDGLQRVANTETPVGTAISAVNGLIAEQ